MRRKYCIGSYLMVWVGLAVVFALPGCGYSVHSQRELPFTEIEVGTIENNTLEPKLQDKLNAALTEEFAQNGIMTLPGAAMKLSGVINVFEMDILSEKEDITVEYRVVIRADFTVVDKDGNHRVFRNIESPFIVSLSAPEDLGRLLATKELAEQRALRDVAMRIVGQLIYQ